MKVLNNVIRWLVGLLFIFSGLVKVNDPVGTAIKLHEYFDVFAVDLPALAGFFKALIPASLPLAVFLVVLEVALGIAVLVNFRMRIILWILLLMIVFFTILTGYSHFTGRVTDCGCFGDAIPLTPKQSFNKDILLTILIAWLFFFRGNFLPAFGRERMSAGITILATIISLWISIAAIRHLPFIDFRPYKVGANIPTAMQPSEPIRYTYIMEKDGEEVELDEYPTDTTYKYVDLKVANPEAMPKITDYSVWNDEGDFTEMTFQGLKLMVVVQDFEKAKKRGLKRLGELAELIESQGGEAFIVTSSNAETTENYRHEYQLAMPYYFGDATLLKAIIRSNPGIVLMRDGTILGKWHANDFKDARKDIPKLLR
ncbi:MAG TPA: DoxX family protein [Cytophagales bacterium]|nr:DoxX family protein [Cytophagales bacterium]HAA19553.1 DoxX family protein [Cytophagales bacterium]